MSTTSLAKRVLCNECMTRLSNVMLKPLPREEWQQPIHLDGNKHYMPVVMYQAIGTCDMHGVQSRKV